MEEDINKPKKGSLFSLDVLLSLLLLVVTLLEVRNSINEHLGSESAERLGPYKFFMLGIVCISFFILLMHGSLISRSNVFLWYGVFYAIVGIFSTFLSGLYPIIFLPFIFVRMSYWVCVLIISYYAVLHFNTFKYHVVIVAVLLPVLFYFFYSTMSIYRGGGRDELALNPVFYISFLLPAVLLLRSKVFKICCVLLIFAAILLSYKRSAMFAFATSVPVYFYAYLNSSTNTKLKKLTTVVFGGTFLLLLLIFSYNYISAAGGLGWAERLEGLTTDRGSGRLDRYIGYMGLLGSQSLYHWILGHGYNYTQFTPYGFAHNDIIEVLYSFGLLGLTFYFLFIGQLVKIFFEMKRYKYSHFDAYAVSLVIFFWGSMFSMLITTPYWFLNMALFWGWVIADFHNAKSEGDPERIGNPIYTYSCEEDIEENSEEGYSYEGYSSEGYY